MAGTERIDILNIGLIVLSAALAVILPFELFLFSYAVFGPLHYLTEISWLHDKNYFTRNKTDYLYLAGLTAVISFLIINSVYHFIDLEISPALNTGLSLLAIMLAVLFVTVKKAAQRIIGVLAILVVVKVASSNKAAMYLMIFLPSMVHIYLFTGLFMLYGALKANSRMGLVGVAAFVLCPVLLLNFFPNLNWFGVTPYAKKTYVGDGVGFLGMSVEMMRLLFGTKVTATTAEESTRLWANNVFHSPNGIAVARVIAFGYTYHYLNWFSKTRIIQWHKVPRSRFVFVVVAWIASVVLYAVNFTTGLVWLFFLSMLHVLLELPLNAVSVMGIFSSLRQRLSGGKQEAEVVVAKK